MSTHSFLIVPYKEINRHYSFVGKTPENIIIKINYYLEKGYRMTEILRQLRRAYAAEITKIVKESFNTRRVDSYRRVLHCAGMTTDEIDIIFPSRMKAVHKLYDDNGNVMSWLKGMTKIDSYSLVVLYKRIDPNVDVVMCAGSEHLSIKALVDTTYDQYHIVKQMFIGGCTSTTMAFTKYRIILKQLGVQLSKFVKK